jgi:hypothetical protein
MAVGYDSLNADIGGTNERLDDFLGRMLRKVIEDVP